jgi:hypothetical protein
MTGLIEPRERASTAMSRSPASSPAWPGSGTIVARMTQSPVTPNVLLRNQTHSAPRFAQMKLRSEVIVPSARAIEGGPRCTAEQERDLFDLTGGR